MEAVETADAVVIGGGILGCSAARHLRQAGVARVVLVEQGPDLAMETTAAGAGFVGLWGAEFGHWGGLGLALERYAHQFYAELHATHDIGLKAVGMLRLAVAPQGAPFLAAQYEHARALVGADEVRLLTSDEVAALLPGLDATKIPAALHWPTVPRIDAPRATRALGHELEAAGVVIRARTQVTAITVAHGRVEGVETSTGRIVAPVVVCAAGAWTQRVGRMVGATLPLTPLLTWRFVTEPLPAVPHDLPMLFLSTYADAQAPHMYAREHNGGLLIGVYPEPFGAPLSHLRDVYPGATPHALTVPPPLIQYADDALRAFAAAWPLLGHIRVTKPNIGLPTYTPDGRHLLGALDGVQGFYVVGGDNEAGISHGPGLGKLLAELVTTGSASMDIMPYRLDRFNGQDHGRQERLLVLQGHGAA